MKLTPRQIQINNWLEHRKTPFQPYATLDFFNKPFDFDFHKLMEFESIQIANQEKSLPPPIRSLDREDLQSVKISRGFLPHWNLSKSTYFVTLCLYNRKMKSLSNPENAQIVEDTIFFYSGKQHEIDAYVIMPDHVHLLITPLEGFELDKILFSIKNFSGKTINKVHKPNNRFWQPECHDHLVRNLGYWIKYFDYIHNNPVKANLVNSPNEFKWSSLSKLYFNP